MTEIARNRKNEILLLLFLLIQSAASAQGTLSGNWKYVYAGGEMKMQITGSTITIDGISYPYKTENNALLVFEESTYTAYPYAVNGNQLELGFPDGSRITFSRESAASAPSDPLSRIIKNPEQKTSSVSSLTGRWLYQSPEGELLLEFISDNQLALNGESAQYSLKEGIIQVMENSEWVDYPYSLNQEKLLITFPGGMQVPFIKTSTAGTVQKAAGDQQSAGTVWQLQGSLCSWAGSSGSSSSYSRTERIRFDGQGSFTFGNESSFTSDAGMAYGSNPNVQKGTYRVEEKVVVLQFQSGETLRVGINMRQNNGMITELMYNDKLYAKALCD